MWREMKPKHVAPPILGPEASGSGTWEEDGVNMLTILMEGDVLKI